MTGTRKGNKIRDMLGTVQILRYLIFEWFPGKVAFNRNFFREIIMTEFSPTHARSAFMCVDEPNSRATVVASFAHSEEMHVISNSHIFRIDPVDGLRTTFYQIDDVSVSSFAIIASDLQNVSMIERNENEELEFYQRFGARELIVNSFNEAFNSSQFLYDLVGDYFGINLTIAKLDSVAVPDLGRRFSSYQALIYYE